MYDRSIAWMMAGGTRHETADEHHARLHSSAIREARADMAARGKPSTTSRPGLVARARTALALAAAGLSPDATPDCCVA